MVNEHSEQQAGKIFSPDIVIVIWIKETFMSARHEDHLETLQEQCRYYLWHFKCINLDATGFGHRGLSNSSRFKEKNSHCEPLL